MIKKFSKLKELYNMNTNVLKWRLMSSMLLMSSMKITKFCWKNFMILKNKFSWMIVEL